MKVLWFTHIPPKATVEREGHHVLGNGFWIHSLIDELVRRGDIRLAVAYPQRGPSQMFEHEGAEYFSIPAPGRLAAVCEPLLMRIERKMLLMAVDIIDRVRPDVLHVHGTERVFGCLKVHHLSDVPTVLSIQGLMMPCAAFAWGDKTFWDMILLQRPWDASRGFPLMRLRKNFLIRGRREVDILRAVDGVIGRTAWDRSYTWSVAPETKYFHVDELMRREFWSEQWSLEKCQRHRVYTSGRLTFQKGMHVFLEAMALLSREYSDLDVRIAGGSAPTCEYHYLLRQVRKLGLSDVVHFTGWIPGQQIVKELQKAHVYANSSFIENGCNALQEAMLMAVPCVTGFVGGMASTLEHRKTGLMYPRGNALMLADRIRELFEDDELAVALGETARKRAQARHAPERIVRDLMITYQTVAKFPAPCPVTRLA